MEAHPFHSASPRSGTGSLQRGQGGSSPGTDTEPGRPRVPAPLGARSSGVLVCLTRPGDQRAGPPSGRKCISSSLTGPRLRGEEPGVRGSQSRDCKHGPGKCGHEQHQGIRGGQRVRFSPSGARHPPGSPFPHTHAEPGKPRCPGADGRSRAPPMCLEPPVLQGSPLGAKSPGTSTLRAPDRGE